jgi:hypothetical protein
VENVAIALTRRWNCRLTFIVFLKNKKNISNEENK